MMSVLKWAAAALVALGAGIVGLVVLGGLALATVLIMLDGNDIRPYAASRLSQALGREVRIEGDLQVDPGLAPRIVVHHIKVADAPWAPRPYMAEIARLAIRFDLPRLLRGDLVLRELVLDRPALTLRTAADGRHNWAFLTRDQPENGAGAPLPIVGALRVGNGVLTYVDARRELRSQVRLDSVRGALTGPQRALNLRAAGSVSGAPLRVQAHAEALAPASDEPLPLRAELRLADARVAAEGTIAAPQDGAPRLRVDLRAEAPDVAALGAVLPWAIPELPGFRASGRLAARPDRLLLEGLDARLGESDLRGRVEVERAKVRPRIRARLASRALDLVQLFGRPTDDGGPLIPDTPIDFSVLQRLDAELRYDARTIFVPRLSLEHVAVEALLQEGVLRFQTLGLELGDGRIRAPELTVNARREPPQIVADVRIESLDLRAALAEMDVPTEAFGTLHGGVQLTGTGRSAAAILGSVEGDVQLIMQRGRLDQLLITLAGQQIPDIVAALGGEDGSTIPLRCLIADFEATDGRLDTSMLLMDTPDVQIIGGGDIDLGSQTVNLAIAPLHKDFSPLAAQAPVHIEGPFQNIVVSVDTAAAVASLITPFELPDTGDADCRALAEAARAE